MVKPLSVVVKGESYAHIYIPQSRCAEPIFGVFPGGMWKGRRVGFGPGFCGVAPWTDYFTAERAESAEVFPFLGSVSAGFSGFGGVLAGPHPVLSRRGGGRRGSSCLLWHLGLFRNLNSGSPQRWSGAERVRSGAGIVVRQRCSFWCFFLAVARLRSKSGYQLSVPRRSAGAAEGATKQQQRTGAFMVRAAFARRADLCGELLLKR